MQAEAPSAALATFPAVQLIHVPTVVAPSTLLAVPSAQSWQSEELVDPTTTPKLPAAHGVQAVAS
jgi:hypothetical protein